MGVWLLDQFTYAVSSNRVIELTKIPQVEPGGYSYLQSLLFRVDITDFDDSTGDADDTEDLLEGIVNNVTMEALGGYWGPQGISLYDMSATYTHMTGRPLSWIETEGNGRASAANQTRQVFVEYPFWAFGEKPADFMPAVRAIAANGGRLQYNTGATADISGLDGALSATIRVYAVTQPADELRAVPRIVTQRLGWDSLINGTIGRGKMLSLLLRNAQADTVIADGDYDGITLKADGRAVQSDVDSPDFAAAFYPCGRDQDFANAAGGAGRHAEYDHGIYSIDGTARTFFSPVYPLQPPLVTPFPVSKRVTANSWTFDVRGAATAANNRWLTTRAFQMGEDTATDQFAACGCDRAKVQEIIRTRPDLLKVKTGSKVPLSPKRADLMGYLPIKLDVNNI